MKWSTPMSMSNVVKCDIPHPLHFTGERPYWPGKSTKGLVTGTVCPSIGKQSRFTRGHLLTEEWGEANK